MECVYAEMLREIHLTCVALRDATKHTLPAGKRVRFKDSHRTEAIDIYVDDTAFGAINFSVLPD